MEKERNPKPKPKTNSTQPSPFSLSPRGPANEPAQLGPTRTRASRSTLRPSSRRPVSAHPPASRRSPASAARASPCVTPLAQRPSQRRAPDKPAPLVSVPPRLPFFNLQPRSPPEDVAGHPYRVRTPRSPEPPLISHPADPCTFILTPKAAQTLARRSVTPSPRRALRRHASGAPLLRSQP